MLDRLDKQDNWFARQHEQVERLTVMYSGEAVEVGEIDTVFNNMRHPYTRGLFSSIPVPGADKNARPLTSIRGYAETMLDPGVPVSETERVGYLRNVLRSPSAWTS